MKGQYGPDLINNFACDFINRHADEKFFLYYPMKLIHVPYYDMPSGEEGNGSSYTKYADKMIQNVVETVDKAGIAENTVIIVTADNGFSWQHQVEVQPGVKKFPGSKGSVLEGSTRVPFIVRWPGMVEAGSVYDGLVDFSDILPTFTQIARTSLPQTQDWKGRSFLPQLLGDKGNPRDWIYIHWGGHPIPTEREVGEYFERGNIMRYVRGIRYKLYADGRFYDMENDIHEENNIPLDTGSDEAEETRKLMQSVLNLHDEGVKEEIHAPRAEVGEFDMSQLPPPIDDEYDY
jgi:arylsulfatase A